MWLGTFAFISYPFASYAFTAIVVEVPAVPAPVLPPEDEPAATSAEELFANILVLRGSAMLDAIELDLPYSSPYRATQLFVKSGRAFFGVWRPPAVKLDGDEEEVIIQRGQEGQLDLLAHAVYGDRELWRIIAQANGIDFPLEQVTPGIRIKIPKPSKVRAALQQGLAARQGVV